MSSVSALLGVGARTAVFGAFALFFSLSGLSATIASQDFGQSLPFNIVQQTIQIPTITPGPATFSLQYSIGDFSLGACTANSNGCALSVSFDPAKPGLRQDAVIVKDANGNVTEEILLYGVGLGPIPVFSPAVAVYESLIRPSYTFGVNGMAVEPDGKVLVLDTGTIYRFDPATNNLSTVATLSTDSGALNLALLAVDAAGNIYYANTSTSEIHVINAITQTDSVVANANPGDMIIDPSGTLFYTQGDQVFKIAPNSSVPTLVAGNGTHGYAGDGGPALQAEFAYPFGIAVDLQGNIYIADSANQRVRKIDTSGNLSTVAGDGSNQDVGDGGLAINAGLNSPSLLAVDAAGDIYVTTGTGDVRRIDSATGIISTIAGASAQTAGTASTKDPFLAVGSASSAQDLGVSSGRGVGTMVLDPDGNLWVGLLSNYQHRLFEISTASLPIQFAYGAIGSTESRTVSLLNAGPAPLNQPTVGISGQSPQYFSQTNNCLAPLGPGATCQLNVTFTAGAEMAPIASITLSDNAPSSPQSIAVSGSSGGFPPATAQLGLEAAGNSSAPQTFHIQFPGSASGLTAQLAYGTDFQLGTVSCTGTGTISCSVTATFMPQYPGVRRDAVQILDSSGAVVYQLNISGVGQAPQWFVLPAATGTIPMPSTQLWLSAIDAAGNLYAIDRSVDYMPGTQVYKYTQQTGQWSVIAGLPIASSVDEGDGGPATAAILSYLNGVAVDSGGNLYIAETFAIRRVDAKTGIITTISHEGGHSIAVDDFGNVYFLNGSDKVRKLDLATGAIVDYAGNGQYGLTGDGGPATSASFEFPKALAFDNDGNLLITDYRGVHKVDASTSIITTYANTCGSDSIAIDAAGDLYLPCGELEFVPAGGGTPQFLENGPVNIFGSVLRDAAGTFYFSSGTTLSAARLPSSLNVGVAVVGGPPNTSSISLTNAGNVSIPSPSVSLSGTNAAAFAETNTCAQAVAPGQSCTVNLSFSPTAVETETATLAVSSSAGNLQTTLSGTGVTASISLIPQQLQFANTGVSLSSYQSIFVSNPGFPALYIAGLSITGPNASDFSVSSTCPQFLFYSRSCQLQIRFSPTAPGTRTATLNIADDATGSPQTVPLSGTAYALTPGNFSLPQGAAVNFSTAGGGLSALLMRTDGNLVAIDKTGATVWSTGTGGQDCGTDQCQAVFQSDGNFVVYKGSTPLWNSGTSGNTSAQLSFSRNSPQVRIVRSDGSTLWANIPTFQAGAFTLKQGQILRVGPAAFLAMQSDGNLVLYDDGSAVWNTGTAGQNCGTNQCQAVFQSDGNFVVYNGSTPVWNSGTWGNPSAQLTFSPQAPEIRVSSPSGSILWVNVPQFAAGDLVLPQGTTANFGWGVLAMQTDGNLVLYRNGAAIWNSGTEGQDCTSGGCVAAFQSDGNFVIYNGSTPLWNSGTFGNPSAQLTFSLEAPQVQIKDANGSASWAEFQAGQFVLQQDQAYNFGSAVLVMQADGNLVLYDGATALWNSGTSGQHCDANNCVAIFQGDGNLVVYNAGTPIWNSGTAGNPDARLDLSTQVSPAGSSAKLGIVGSKQSVLWNSVEP